MLGQQSSALEIESTLHQRDTEMKGVYKLGTYVPKIATSCWGGGEGGHPS